mmetsp:Transcript_3520/g.6595  ORF Transcript_3520/g.6595 Transcript_3520/m.6595 type:complete len:215 (+) Transcript_3520:685-1329(+)
MVLVEARAQKVDVRRRRHGRRDEELSVNGVGSRSRGPASLSLENSAHGLLGLANHAGVSRHVPSVLDGAVPHASSFDEEDVHTSPLALEVNLIPPLPFLHPLVRIRHVQQRTLRCLDSDHAAVVIARQGAHGAAGEVEIGRHESVVVLGRQAGDDFIKLGRFGVSGVEGRAVWGRFRLLLLAGYYLRPPRFCGAPFGRPLPRRPSDMVLRLLLD